MTDDTFSVNPRAHALASLVADGVSAKIADAVAKLVECDLNRSQAIGALCDFVMRSLWEAASEARKAEGGVPNPAAFVGVAERATRPRQAYRFIVESF